MPEIIGIVFFVILIFGCVVVVYDNMYDKFQNKVLKELGLSDWNMVPYFDKHVIVNSRKTLEKYDFIKFFVDHEDGLVEAQMCLNRKTEVTSILNKFVLDNDYKNNRFYKKLMYSIDHLLKNAEAYRVLVEYISTAGNHLGTKEVCIHQSDIDVVRNNPFLLLSVAEQNRYYRELNNERLILKQHEYLDKVNNIIEYVNTKRSILFINGSVDSIDNLIDRLVDNTVREIIKIKTIDSIEWDIIGKLVKQIDNEIKEIVLKNEKILNYYESDSFTKIKDACSTLITSQRDFNDYISKKVESVSSLFGTKVVRNETINNDRYKYIRPYKKSISPFTAEVSASVFSSAENSPMEYIIKIFYPNKGLYGKQIQNLKLLLEELATLRDAKLIIENYKKDYQQYLNNVPSYVLINDEAGFYNRLGFANVDENSLVVEYKFSYTSNGGFAKRTFTVPMTEDIIVDLINALENKMSASAFTKDQRALMTNSLRQHIKERDNYTCCNCGNSVHCEPNLLLEIDHIVPVSKGGCTVENNLQTLCWKCNRAKGNKIIN